MGTAALVARIPLAGKSKTLDGEFGELGLGFDRPGGPVLAVCALAGGAGATTFAYLIAAAAARESRQAILVSDTGGPTAGLSALAGVGTDHSMAEIAEMVADEEEPTERVWAEGDFGLRVIATSPRFRMAGDDVGMAGVLEKAKAAHGLTVVDCGTLQREADQVALQLATHAAWILPATVSGARQAERTLGMVMPCEGREAVVARAASDGGRASMKALKALAAERSAPLLLMPEIPDPQEKGAGRAIEVAQTTLTALGAVLRR